MNKRITILIISANILILLFTTGLLYYDRTNLISKYSKEKNLHNSQIKELQKQLTEEKNKSENVFANITSDWKTYRDQGLGIQIEAPPKANVQDYFNDDTNRLVSFVSDDANFTVRLKEGKGKNGAGTFDIPFEKFYYLDFPIDSTVEINNMKFNVYKAPGGYCDGPGCGTPFIAYATEKNDTFYIISFYDNDRLSDIENQILKNFIII